MEKKRSFRNLMNGFSVHKHAKIFGAIPFVIVLIAVIVVVALGATSSSYTDAVGIGIDFEGGTILTVALGQDAIDNYEENRVRITEAIEEFGVTVSYVQQQSANNAANSAIAFRYKNIDSDDSAISKRNADIRNAVDKLFNSTEFRIVLGEQAEAKLDEVKTKVGNILNENGIDDFDIALYKEETVADSYISVAYENIPETDEDMKAKNQKIRLAIDAEYPDASISDSYSSPKITYESIGATAASDLLEKAGIALAVSVAIILVYIIIRFTLMSGFAAIIALLHDVVIMFCLTVICRVQINSSYVAAMITIIAYSINNTIIIFDRCRESLKPLKGQKNIDYVGIGDEAVRATMTRSIYTTLTTMVTVIFLAILGSDSIREFCVPIILGLIAGLYSSVFLATPLWSAMSISFDKTKEKYAKRGAVSYDKPEEEDKTVVKDEEPESAEEIAATAPRERKPAGTKPSNHIYKYSKKNVNKKK